MGADTAASIRGARCMSQEILRELIPTHVGHLELAPGEKDENVILQFKQRVPLHQGVHPGHVVDAAFRNATAIYPYKYRRAPVLTGKERWRQPARGRRFRVLWIDAREGGVT
jgi:hypothetical protein